MEHGIHSYFAERERNAHRLSGLSFAVALVMLGAMLVLRASPLGDIVRESSLMRFGLQGPPRMVELVQLEAEPMTRQLPQNVGLVILKSGRAGAEGAAPAVPTRRRARPATPGVGADAQAGRDLVARAMASRGRVPIFQSEDLVIEELVRPQYPETVRDRGVEGRVAVLAHVDTLGRVIEAEVMKASGEPLLDAASRTAVLKCRFRPYRVESRAQEVYAVFRFSFRIY